MTKRYCDKCGQQFGSAWQALAKASHMWKEHGIPGEASFNGVNVKFGEDTDDKE